MDDLYISDEVYSQLAKALDPTAATRCELTLTLLCDSGNVVFDLADRKQYLVSSTVLGLASNAIGKLLSAIYLEGQLLSKEAPPTVPFPNDDAAAMRHMLRFLHHKSTERIEQSTTAILNLVLVAEKYGCLSALRAHIMVILKDARDIVWRQSIPTLYNRASAHLNELLDLIAIAYVVRDARVFTRSCRQLIDAAQDSTLAHAHSARGSHLIAPELYRQYYWHAWG